jgi:hypothetical protein
MKLNKIFMIQSEKQPLGMTRTGFRDEWWPDEGERGAATAQAATERSGRERREKRERRKKDLCGFKLSTSRAQLDWHD